MKKRTKNNDVEDFLMHVSASQVTPHSCTWKLAGSSGQRMHSNVSQLPTPTPTHALRSIYHFLIHCLPAITGVGTVVSNTRHRIAVSTLHSGFNCDERIWKLPGSPLNNAGQQVQDDPLSIAFTCPYLYLIPLLNSSPFSLILLFPISSFTICL